MKRLFYPLALTCLMGCSRFLTPVAPTVLTPGKYTVDHRGHVSADINISGGGADTIVRVDSVVLTPVMLYNGLIIFPSQVKGDTISRVWLQWDEGGAWIPYDLADSLRQ